VLESVREGNPTVVDGQMVDKPVVDKAQLIMRKYGQVAR
jgi:citrate lyase beta subunit